MRAIEKFLNHYDGNQSQAARDLQNKFPNVRQQYLSYWLLNCKEMPVKYMPEAAKLIGMELKDFCPEIFS